MPTYGVRHFVVPFEYWQFNLPALPSGVDFLILILFVVVTLFLLYCALNYLIELFSGRSLRARRLARKKARREKRLDEIAEEPQMDTSAAAVSSDND